VGKAYVQLPAGLWRSACVGRRAAQGVKGELPLARAVVAETFADGKGFCKHGCRASDSLNVINSDMFKAIYVRLIMFNDQKIFSYFRLKNGFKHL